MTVICYGLVRIRDGDERVGSISAALAAWRGGVGKIVPTIRVYGRRLLVALEEQLPGTFVSSSEEPFEGLVLRRIEFP